MTGRSTFDTVRISGGLLSSGLLERVGVRDRSLEAAAPSNYYLAPEERLGEAITRSWNRLSTLWDRFSGRLEQEGALTGPTRQEWLLPLFQELGYGHLGTAPGFELGGKSYPISHLWESTPLHLVGVGVDLDRRSPGVAGAASASPHGLVQEFLNRSDDHLWALVSNGRQLRLLRDNASLTRIAYVEFDLREMFGGEVYSDFALLWLTCHASRLEGPAGNQVLERWRQDAAKQGVRALDTLRDGVEAAIESLGSAAVSHSHNLGLRQSLDEGTLDAQDLYRQILRVVYRLLFLLVAEARNLLLDPKADSAARARYQRHYSITRLRDLAEIVRGGAHGDLWQQHAVVARALGSKGEPALGLPPLGGFLWSQDAIGDLNDVTLPNEALLSAVRALTTVRLHGELTQRVGYTNLGAEELGSIYESLLEYVPEVNAVAGTFELKRAAGNERKTTGSYYTPTVLINELLNSALEPVLAEAAQAEDPEKAILDLKVVDPAAGSGHFLIAAANRMADRLARVRVRDDEPSPDQFRTALRDVIGDCIYAVDINPLAVELAKVALWIEAMEPGKPLTFLDHHIVCGNSLLGVTPKLLEEGIPNDAFKALTGDDKDHVKVLRTRNRQELRKGLVALTFGDSPDDLLRHAAEELTAIDHLDNDSLESIGEKQRRYEELTNSREQERLRLAADTWVAAFVGPKVNGAPEPTTAVVNAALHDPDSISQGLVEQIASLAGRFRFHHWHLAFPDIFASESSVNEQTGRSGGFDIVLGNPPWERVKLQEKEFFANSAPEIAKAPNKAARTRLIDALQIENPGLWQQFQAALHDAEAVSHFLRTSGVYPLCGRGDVNTYTVFAEAMRNLVAPKGRTGLVVPSGIATDDTTKFFFSDLVRSAAIASLYELENEGFFAVGQGHMNRFCLLTVLGHGQNADAANYLFQGKAVADIYDKDRVFSLSSADFALLNPNTRTCPIFRTRRDAHLVKSIYGRVPILLDESTEDSNPWGISLSTMFHMSNDSDVFRTNEDLRADGWQLHGNVYHRDSLHYLPLYEAKMFHLFNHRHGDFSTVPEGQKGHILPTPSITKLADQGYRAQPRYWVPGEIVDDKLGNEAWTIAYRWVTDSRASARTVVVAGLPRVGLGNSAPIITIADRRTTSRLFLLAAMSSHVFDYVARQKVPGNNLTFSVFKQLPLPGPTSMNTMPDWLGIGSFGEWVSQRVIELVFTARDLQPLGLDIGTQNPFRWDAQRRFMLTSELDAAFFHLYRIDRGDVEYIMETFPVVKRKDIAEHGTYRTKKLILDVYDRMTKTIETSEPYQTILNPPPADPSLCHSAVDPGQTATTPEPS